MPAYYRTRLATSDDAQAIAEFQTATWNEAYEGLVRADYLARMTVPTRRERWGKRLLAGERQIMLTERDGVVVAVMSFGERSDDRPGPRLELMSIYLSAPARGTGLADYLVQYALGDADAVLWVFEANARAIAFYRRHGFVPDGETMFDTDTGLPEIRMSRVSPAAGR